MTSLAIALSLIFGSGSAYYAGYCRGRSHGEEYKAKALESLDRILSARQALPESGRWFSA